MSSQKKKKKESVTRLHNKSSKKEYVMPVIKMLKWAF